MRLIRSGYNIPVHPRAAISYVHTFDKEIRDPAAWLLRFCKERYSWNPFTVEEIQNFYADKGPVPHPALGTFPRFDLAPLVQGGFVAGPFYDDVQIPGSSWRQIERDAIHCAVTRMGGNLSAAARFLGVSNRMIQYRRHAWRKDPPQLYFLTDDFLACLGITVLQAGRSPGEAYTLGTLEEIQSDAIRKTLKAANGSTGKAARMLGAGISVRTIQGRLKAWGMKSKDFRQQNYLAA